MNERAARLMSVRTELVREHLVATILDRAEDGPPGEAPKRSADLMRHALEAVAGREVAALASEEAIELANELARLGYRCRRAEVELFEAAAQTHSGHLSDWLDPDMAVELTRAEPEHRPDPADATATWRVPGPGGHVRHYVALAAIGSRVQSDEDGGARLPAGLDSAGVLKRCWIYGFLLGCCEEVPET